MQRILESTKLSVLAAAAFLFAAAPAQAQGLVTIGSGSYLSPSNPLQTSHFAHVVTEGGNGAVHGHAIWFFPNTTIVVQVTSYGFFEFTPGTNSLAFAGTIVAILGNPANPLATVGRTAFTAMNDNGPGFADETAGLSLLPPLASLPPVPPQFGNLTTIQEIIGFGEFYSFPAPVFSPLLTGKIRIR